MVNIFNCRSEEAEKMFIESLTVHRLNLPPKSYYTLLNKATVGTFWKTREKPILAIDLLHDVADHIGKDSQKLKI